MQFVKELKCVCPLFVRLRPIRGFKTVVPGTKYIRKVDGKKADAERAVAPLNYRFLYPEFLPEVDPENRHAIREKLERADLLRRRSVIDIPEFYVGTIMAVTVSDMHSPGRKNRFVGICIDRGGQGTRAWFTLRNVVDGHGVEIMYDMYNPTILRFEVLKLEKRPDPHLRYLRDAPYESYTYPFDMQMEPHPEGVPVPVNMTKYKLSRPHWHERWERQDLHGIHQESYKLVPEKHLPKIKKMATPWAKYDLMKEYRATVPLEDQQEIYNELLEHKITLEKTGEQVKKPAKVFVKPTKLY